MGWSCIGRSLIGLRVACSDNERCAWYNRNVMHSTQAGIVTKLTPPSGKGCSNLYTSIGPDIERSSDTSTFS